MNEQIPNEQAAHAAKFVQVSRNLKTVAEALVVQYPEFPPQDFARAFLFVAIALLLPAAGDGGTADYLRTMADMIERGERPALN